MTDFTKLVFIYMAPTFICAILLWLRRPQIFVQDGYRYKISTHRNGWLATLLGIFFMLAILMVGFYVYRLGIQFAIGLMIISIGVFIAGLYLTWGINRGNYE